MKIPEVITNLNIPKTFSLEPYKLILYVLAGVLLLSVLVWISNSNPRQSVVRDILDQQAKIIEAEYKIKIKEKEVVIEELQKKIEDSKKVEVGLKNEIKRLSIERGKIYEPTSRKESMDRYNKLGYPPNK